MPKPNSSEDRARNADTIDTKQVTNGHSGPV